MCALWDAMSLATPRHRTCASESAWWKMTNTRATLAALFDGTPGFRCVSAHASTGDAFAHLPLEECDVVLLDLIPKAEGRIRRRPSAGKGVLPRLAPTRTFGLRASDFFRISDFELRISVSNQPLPNLITASSSDSIDPHHPIVAFRRPGHGKARPGGGRACCHHDVAGGRPRGGN